MASCCGLRRLSAPAFLALQQFCAVPEVPLGLPSRQCQYAAPTPHRHAGSENNAEMKPAVGELPIVLSVTLNMIIICGFPFVLPAPH